jgi:hypothetical protein
MPIKPSAGNWSLSKPVEYWVAAPSVVWAYGVARQCLTGEEKDDSSYSQAGDVNNIGIYLDADGGAIPI